jgi:hypothetical protein
VNLCFIVSLAVVDALGRSEERWTASQHDAFVFGLLNLVMNRQWNFPSFFHGVPSSSHPNYAILTKNM